MIQVGDTWSNFIYPFIDYSTGGSIDGMIRATERNLVITEKTIVIPGQALIRHEHFPLSDLFVNLRSGFFAK